MNFRSKPVGWRNESYRHYLAAKGVSTSHKKYNAVIWTDPATGKQMREKKEGGASQEENVELLKAKIMQGAEEGFATDDETGFLVADKMKGGAINITSKEILGPASVYNYKEYAKEDTEKVAKSSVGGKRGNKVVDNIRNIFDEYRAGEEGELRKFLGLSDDEDVTNLNEGLKEMLLLRNEGKLNSKEDAENLAIAYSLISEEYEKRNKENEKMNVSKGSPVAKYVEGVGWTVERVPTQSPIRKAKKKEVSQVEIDSLRATASALRESVTKSDTYKGEKYRSVSAEKNIKLAEELEAKANALEEMQ